MSASGAPADGGLADVLLFLIAGLFAALLLHRVKGSPILGYLLAGLAIGPHGLGLLAASETIHLLAEFGIVFLMFGIGLEISVPKLIAMRGLVFGFGALQVTTAAIALAGLSLLFGLKGPEAAVTGLALALSSTAVVARLLIDRGALATRVGRRAFAILLFQDIAVAPILILVAILAGDAPVIGAAAFLAIAQAAAALILVLLAGRYLARPLFRAVAAMQSSELFVGATLFLMLGAAWLMDQAGLSMALGAFLAGLLISETEYAPQVELDIGPFRGLLLGLFFMTIGMGLDARYLLSAFDDVLLFLLAMLLIKSVLIFLLGRFFDLSHGARVALGLLLAQGGEFALVVFALAGSLGLLAPSVAQFLTVVVGLSLALTPLLAAAGHRLGEYLDGRMTNEDAEKGKPLDADLEGHVVIAGFGRVGRTVAHLLSQQRIAYVAIDRDPEIIARAIRAGRPVYFGNCRSPALLRRMGLARASALVVTLNDDIAALGTVRSARRLVPDIRIIARAHDLEHGRALERNGANISVPETLESSLQIAAQTLKSLGISHATVDETIDRLRQDDYAAIRDAVSPEEDKEESDDQGETP